MGLDLTYDANGTTFSHRFSHADWDTIDALRAHLPKDVEICFGVPELGEAVQIKTAALKDSARNLDRFLADHGDLLPATYQFKLESFFGRDPARDRVPGGSFDTGGISGFRLPGDPDHYYTIQSGLNECRLEKWAVGPDGKGMIVENRDIRGEPEVVTENCGKVQIRRRAAKTTLRRTLREIARFADSITSEELTKILR